MVTAKILPTCGGPIFHCQKKFRLRRAELSTPYKFAVFFFLISKPPPEIPTPEIPTPKKSGVTMIREEIGGGYLGGGYFGFFF